MPRKIIIDTDPGVDDTMAILFRLVLARTGRNWTHYDLRQCAYRAGDQKRAEASGNRWTQ